MPNTIGNLAIFQELNEEKNITFDVITAEDSQIVIIPFSEIDSVQFNSLFRIMVVLKDKRSIEGEWNLPTINDVKYQPVLVGIKENGIEILSGNPDEISTIIFSGTQKKWKYKMNRPNSMSGKYWTYFVA